MRQDITDWANILLISGNILTGVKRQNF